MPRIPLLDLQAQFRTISDDVYRAMREVVESQGFVLGPSVAGFEEALAGYTGSRHAIGCASGTDALILAFAGLDVGIGDEVVTSPFSFFSTASCAYKVGARPRFVDILPDTFNLDPAKVDEVASHRTGAILPVHLFGQCADMDAILEIASARRIPVVEDAAQALGASYRRDGEWRSAGAIGAVGCYSFFPTKNLGGFGDGGAMVTDDDDLAAKLRLLRVHGGQQMYHHEFVGWNSRLDALQAAVLGVKLPHLDGWCEARIANADRYDRWFRESGLVDAEKVVLPARRDSARHIFNQYTIRVPDRDGLREALARDEIGCSVYYPVALHLQECFRDLGYSEGDFPEAERASREVLSLPVYAELEPAQQERVVAAIASHFGVSA